MRSNELQTLTRASFKFGKRLATVTVEARNSKRRRQDELPIRPETAAAIQLHLAAKHPGARAFTMPERTRIAKMLRQDLKAAREAWLDEAATAEDRAERERSMFLAERDDAGGVVDFHGLRHTFITLLARSGVHPSVMQAMARHSDPKLTLSRYTHVETAEQAAALELLPDFSTPAGMRALATGTDGQAAEPKESSPPRNDDQTANSVLAFCLAFSDANQCAEVQSDAPMAEMSAHEKTSANIAFTEVSAERMGFEPMVRCDPYTGLANRRFRPLSHLSS